MCIIITLFFFNDTATTEIYTLSLHDALPIYGDGRYVVRRQGTVGLGEVMNLLGVVASDEIHAVSVRPHPFSVGPIHSHGRDVDAPQEVVGRGSAVRSEERRVGKERRSRWSPYH